MNVILCVAFRYYAKCIFNAAIIMQKAYLNIICIYVEPNAKNHLKCEHPSYHNWYVLCILPEPQFYENELVSLLYGFSN